ncbi:MAG: helix-turn-helix domain-containing protein [Acidobacteria bacterium]|nr:helix-turn-helix domain-containing protein [Acidobacteriota bacterium]
MSVGIQKGRQCFADEFGCTTKLTCYFVQAKCEWFAPVLEGRNSLATIKVDRATEILGNKNEHQTYRQVREGYIPAGVAFWIGKRLRFDEEQLNAWIAKGGTPIGQQHQSADQCAAAA